MEKIARSICILFLSMSATPAYAELPCESYDESSPSISLDDEISEISGLSRSRTNGNFYWAHTDSGGKPILYLLDTLGKVRQRYTIEGVENTDWEDIAVAPCAYGSRETCIYIGDMGDNLFSRNDKKIHIVREPKIGEQPEREEKTTLPVWRTIVVSYPATESTEGRFINPDCESLMVAPSGEIYVISKQSSGGEQTLYRVPREGERVVLEPLGSYTFTSLLGSLTPLYNAVTGADFSRDGKRFLIRTYATIYEYDLVAYPTMSEAYQHPHEAFAGAEIQGEAVAYMSDDMSVMTAAEKPPIGTESKASMRSVTCREKGKTAGMGAQRPLPYHLWQTQQSFSLPR